MKIKRWDVIAGMNEHPQGDYVKLEDYEEAVARTEELEAILREATDFLDDNYPEVALAVRKVLDPKQ